MASEHAHGHPHHGGYREEYNSNFFVRLVQECHDRLKSMDGIDEMAQVAGQVLPGLAGPIATASILTIATPFVYIGLMGMKDEYLQACREYEEILKSNIDTKAKLSLLAKNSDKWREFLSRKLQLGIPDKSPNSNQALGKLELDNKGLNEFANCLVESEILRNEVFILLLGKKYGWTGVVGMGGMFVGLLPTTAASGIGIAKELGKAGAAATIAASGLATASSSVFFIGQAAMAVYAFNRYRQGKVTERLLDSHIKQFNSHHEGINNTTRDAILEILEKQHKFNRAHSIHYGLATDAGQAAMMTATLLNFIPMAGNLASIPFLAVGAPLTVGAAIGRIVYEAKEGKFEGSETQFSNQRCENRDLLPLLDREMHNPNIKNQYIGVRQTLGDEFEFCSKQLSYSKFYSLLNHFINDKKYIRYPSEKKLLLLEQVVENGNLSSFKGTGLQGDILTRVQGIFNNNRDKITALLNMDIADANKTLLANVVTCANAKRNEDLVFDSNIDTAFEKEKLKDVLKSLLPPPETNEEHGECNNENEGDNEDQEPPKQSWLSRIRSVFKRTPTEDQNSLLNNEHVNNDELLELPKNLPEKPAYNVLYTKLWGSGELEENDYKTLNKFLIKKLKSSLKFTRLDIADKFITLAHMEELRDLIAKENVQQKTIKVHTSNISAARTYERSKPPTPLRIAPQRPIQPKGKQEFSLKNNNPASGLQKFRTYQKAEIQQKLKLHSPANSNNLNYEGLKKSLENIDDKQSFEQKITHAIKHQVEIDKIRQEAVNAKLNFKLIGTYKNKDGDTIYAWEDPNHPGKQAEYGVTYTQDKLTGKVAVTYGSKASAFVMFDADIKKGISPLLMEIKQSSHAVFGDKCNPHVNISSSGLHLGRMSFVKSKTNSYVDSYMQKLPERSFARYA